MTDCKNALIELLAEIKTGNGVKYEYYKSAFPDHASITISYATISHAAYNGSLDAAKALHEAVLPGWPVRLTDLTPDWCGGHGWCASLNYLHMEWQETFTAYPPSHFAHSAYNANPARAWLIAILNTLIADENINVNSKGE
tara:strand:+ start:423 stop:845 length:423 start_codon:yes stop_codon:yes gene_type:complete